MKEKDFQKSQQNINAIKGLMIKNADYQVAGFFSWGPSDESSHEEALKAFPSKLWVSFDILGWLNSFTFIWNACCSYFHNTIQHIRCIGFMNFYFFGLKYSCRSGSQKFATPFMFRKKVSKDVIDDVGMKNANWCKPKSV